MSAVLEFRDELGGDETVFFEKIALDLQQKGFSINPCALPKTLSEDLYHHLQTMPQFNFEQAGIGRYQEHVLNNVERTEEIRWIKGK